MRRATVSVGPPAAAGTMIVIGLAGKAVCAAAGCDTNIDAAAIAPESIVRRSKRMWSLPAAQSAGWLLSADSAMRPSYDQVSRTCNRHMIIQIFDIISRGR